MVRACSSSCRNRSSTKPWNLQSVEIQMDKRRIPVRVVLGEGEGRTGDRFGDAIGLGQALQQRGFPCSDLALAEDAA